LFLFGWAEEIYQILSWILLIVDVNFDFIIAAFGIYIEFHFF